MNHSGVTKTSKTWYEQGC